MSSRRIREGRGKLKAAVSDGGSRAPTSPPSGESPPPAIPGLTLPISDPAPGTIQPSDGWVLTTKRRVALERLRELGVSIRSLSYRPEMFVVEVPHNLLPPIYIEIGFLLAQLTDDGFPEQFHKGICDVPSRVLKGSQHRAPVEFPESYYHALKFYVWPERKRKRRETVAKSDEEPPQGAA